MKLDEWSEQPSIPDSVRRWMREQTDRLGARELASYAIVQEAHRKPEIQVLVATDRGLWFFKYHPESGTGGSGLDGRLFLWHQVSGFQLESRLEPTANMGVETTWRFELREPAFTADGGTDDNKAMTDFARACVERL